MSEPSLIDLTDDKGFMERVLKKSEEMQEEILRKAEEKKNEPRQHEENHLKSIEESEEE